MRDPAHERFERSFGPEFGHDKPFDLTRLRPVLAALGAPQTKLPPTIHVAGTNGKGSTIAFMRAIAEAAGLNVHAFTKPHLFKLNERFLVAGRAARDDELVAAAHRIAEVSTDLTQFDAQAAAAFLLFSETPADLVLLETGMGGRNDSTNVIEHPAASVITPIGLDHQDVLGATLADIAAHKAGILKRGAPAVIARQADAAREVIETEARRVGAHLFRYGVEWDAFEQAGKIVVQTSDRLVEFWPPGLLRGGHQIDNAGLGIAALWAAGLLPAEIDRRIERAPSLAWVHLAGRLSPLRHERAEPIKNAGGEVWIDVGHNAHAAAALARELNAMQKRREADTVAIIGMRARKDAEAFVGALADAVDHIIAVPLSEAHVAPDMLMQIAEMMGVEASEAPSLDAAMKSAARFAEPRVLICGSFLLAAEAMAVDERAN